MCPCNNVLLLQAPKAMEPNNHGLKLCAKIHPSFLYIDLIFKNNMVFFTDQASSDEIMDSSKRKESQQDEFIIYTLHIHIYTYI